MENNDENTTPNMIKIAAWRDGFWIDDLEGAEEADSVSAFGELKHQVIEVPADCSEETVQQAIAEAFKPKLVEVAT